MSDTVIDKFNFFDLQLDKFTTSHNNIESCNMITTLITDTYTESNVMEEIYNSTYCEKLNSNISNAISMYEKEITKVSEINSDMDALKHKYKKTIKWIENMNNEVNSFRVFSTKYFKPNLPLLYSDITKHVDSISNNLQCCEKTMNNYVENTIESNKHIYKSAKKCVKSLDKVFCILKRNKYSCPICIQNEVSVLVVPCGHTYCKQCSMKMETTCFICRQPIIKLSPLFFDE